MAPPSGSLNINYATLFPVFLFLVGLVAYTVQTTLTSIIQSPKYGYNQPYFLLYTGHSAYFFVLPLQLAGMWCTGWSRAGLSREMRRVKAVMVRNRQTREAEGAPRIGWRDDLLKTSFLLTIMLALPALSWYVAIPFSTMTDVSALYNTFAVWAYIISVRQLGERPTPRKLAGILGAVVGVFVITYGDSLMIMYSGEEDETKVPTEGGEEHTAAEKLLGNGLALAGGISYAFYEVFYKARTELRMSPATGPVGLGLVPKEHGSPQLRGGYSTLDVQLEDRDSAEGSEEEQELLDEAKAYDPSELPAHRATGTVAVPPMTQLLHTSLLSSLMGIFTFLALAVPLPILHWTGLETFKIPDSWELVGLMVANATCGLTFNVSFMVLITTWGPVIASVGNLCTLVLVAFADVVTTGKMLTLPSAVGCGMIMAGFAALVFGSGGEGGGH